MTQQETMSISMLASGSSGNATYVETKGQRLLIDAGLSGKKIEQLFQQIDRKVSDLNAILVTHEHVDHVRGVGILSRKYHLPVYANAATWKMLDKSIGDIDPECRKIIEPDQLVTFGDLDVLSYEVSHDAIQPQFYAFQQNGKQFAMLTDTGYVSDKLRRLLYNADAYLIECNHEVEMLRYGSRPWSTKQRILGDKGHLNNTDGALAMVDMIGDKTRHVYLGHLSRENNTKELALSTMSQILTQHDIAVQQDVSLWMTDPEIATVLNRL